MLDPRVLRVFLSSPGDVQTERDAADAVLTALQRSPAWRGKFTFEVVRWDDPEAPVPMDAHLTPQQAVDAGMPKPSECDITVVILWSRMGTPLKHENRRYLSGTEYEYEDARKGAGNILPYRRTDKPQLDIDDEAFEEKRQQYQSVNQFFGRFTNEDGTLSGGYTPYEGAEAFEIRFRQDIETILRQIDAPRARAAGVIIRVTRPDVDFRLSQFGVQQPSHDHFLLLPDVILTNTTPQDLSFSVRVRLVDATGGTAVQSAYATLPANWQAVASHFALSQSHLTFPAQLGAHASIGGFVLLPVPDDIRHRSATVEFVELTQGAIHSIPVQEQVLRR